jgi:hypothetical protein
MDINSLITDDDKIRNITSVKNPHILLVDDNPFNNICLNNYCMKINIEIITSIALNGL